MRGIEHKQLVGVAWINASFGHGWHSRREGQLNQDNKPGGGVTEKERDKGGKTKSWNKGDGWSKSRRGGSGRR